MILRRGYGKIIGTPKLYTNLKTDKHFTIHAGKEFVYDSLHVSKDHGTVFAIICFVSHKYPILSASMQEPLLRTINNHSNKSKSKKTRKTRK